MAEGLCRSFLGHFRLQDRVEAASAGLSAMDGKPASREAVAIMAEREIDLSGHQTACLTDEQVRRADLILTMEEHHRRRLLEYYPETASKTFVLKEYVAQDQAEPSVFRSGHVHRIPFGPGVDRMRRTEGSGCGGGLDAEKDTRAPGAADRGRYDIMDPFGRSAEAYRRCAMELSSAVADLCIDLYHQLNQDSN
jgi:protein-tyrosine-phosphatase